jgi:amidase
VIGPLHTLGALELAAAQAAGEVSSALTVAALLSRIGQYDPAIRSLVAIASDVMEQAEAADARRAAGMTRSRLDGVPVVIKDNIECRGLPGTAGSAALAGSPPRRDAELVRRLRHAGLVILGAANLSEWANFRGMNSTSGWSAVGGLTDNPWLAGHSAGGSSSGSGAALAAGLAPLAIGTETDGSIVCPASLCGVVGLKPTVGSVPTAAVVPISASQDSPGPMARSVADVAALLSVLTGGATPAGSGMRAPALPRVGFVPAWGAGDSAVDDLVAAAVDQLATAGHAVAQVEVPVCDDQVGNDELVVLAHEMGEDLNHYLQTRPGCRVRGIAEVVAFNEAHADLELAHFGQEYLELALSAGGRKAPTYHLARSRNLRWARDRCLSPALGEFDVLVSLAYGPAWRSDLAGGDRFSTGLATHASAIAGWPLLSVPIGAVNGLPIGLAVIGGPGGEAAVLQVAATVERCAGWAGRIAPLAT